MDMQQLYEKYPSLRKLEIMGDDYVEWNDGREPALLRWLHAHPSFPAMRNSARRICAAMDEFAAQHDFLINIGSDKAAKAAAVIAQISPPPRVCVELGGYVGYSALWFGQALRDAHEHSPTRTAGVRYWSLEADPVFAAIAMSLVELAGLSDIVSVVTGEAAVSLARLKGEGALETLDFVFLDHVEELYHVDMQKIEELGLVKVGTTVVADNVLRPGAPRYREYIRGRPGWETRVIEGLIMPGEFTDELDISVFRGSE